MFRPLLPGYNQVTSSFLEFYYLLVTWWWPGDRGRNMLSPYRLK